MTRTGLSGIALLEPLIKIGRRFFKTPEGGALKAVLVAQAEGSSVVVE